jgi:hypothetical protein
MAAQNPQDLPGRTEIFSLEPIRKLLAPAKSLFPGALNFRIDTYVQIVKA